MPARIQLSRRAGWRKPEGAVVVSRPSKWGNPYKLSDYRIEGCGSNAERERVAREKAVQDYEAALSVDLLDYSEADVQCELRGKDLACWCPLPKAGQRDVCHAAVLLEVANR